MQLKMIFYKFTFDHWHSWVAMFKNLKTKHMKLNTILNINIETIYSSFEPTIRANPHLCPLLSLSYTTLYTVCRPI